ncbi:hypothetical protein H4R18_001037 [Coemansia javaensis]|uniref:26S proteasome complex subunit SEM1 n=1 Tax=Coemansia javaensis TaxID=2761396 RepID=A0A9W8HKW3_9FUNG|nr:hypothetical protein H4R18_001037 [Coemansia javaensis]
MQQTAPQYKPEAAPAASNSHTAAGGLDEDDEFEEFEVEDWDAADIDGEDLELWDDDWEEDDLSEFPLQLRAMQAIGSS